MDALIFKEESFKIVGAAMEVHRVLGCGFSEPVYQDALELEFKARNIPYEREKTFYIDYKGNQLNKYYRVDFLCYDKIIVETKAVTTLDEGHMAQIYNYLKASNMNLGVLINFGQPSLETKRIPCTTKWAQQ